MVFIACVKRPWSAMDSLSPRGYSHPIPSAAPERLDDQGGPGGVRQPFAHKRRSGRPPTVPPRGRGRGRNFFATSARSALPRQVVLSPGGTFHKGFKYWKRFNRKRGVVKKHRKFAGGVENRVPRTRAHKAGGRLCPGAPKNNNTYLTRRRRRGGATPLDSRLRSKAGILQGLDKEEASLATNLDFGGSNYGSHIGDLCLQPGSDAVLPSPQLGVAELPIEETPIDVEKDYVTPAGQSAKERIQELEALISVLRQDLEEEREARAQVQAELDRLQLLFLAQNAGVLE